METDYAMALHLMKKYGVSTCDVANKAGVHISDVEAFLEGSSRRYSSQITQAVSDITVPLIMARHDAGVAALRGGKAKKNKSSGPETAGKQKTPCEQPEDPKKPTGLTDEEVEREIERLSKSPLVALARRKQRIDYRRRQRLYNLRDLEKRGKALLEAGITMEVLNAMDTGCDEPEES